VKLLRPKDLVDILGISRGLVTELLRSGEIPAIVIRSGQRKTTFRIRESALEVWMRKRETRRKIRVRGADATLD